MPHLTMPDWLPGETGPPVPSWEAHTDPNRVESEQTDTTRTGTDRRGTAVAARGSRTLQGNREKSPKPPEENRLRRLDTTNPARRSLTQFNLDKRATQD